MKTITSAQFKEIIGSYSHDAADQQPDFSIIKENISSDINIALTNLDLTKAIYKLMELEDCENDIFWTIMPLASYDSYPMIIRDARYQEKLNYQEYGLAINAVNYVRAAMELCKITRGKSLSAKNSELLCQFIFKFWQRFQKCNVENRTVEVNLFICIITQFFSKQLNIPQKIVAKRLSIAKDYMNFYDKTFHVTTLCKHLNIRTRDEYFTFKADLAICGLSAEQKSLFMLENKHQLPIWFQRLPSWEQQLVKHILPKITNDKHVFPTQLRHIPGVRNFYRQISGVLTNTDVIIKNTTHKSGTIAQFCGDTKNKIDKANNLSLASSNLTQLAELINAEQADSVNIHMLTLNTPQFGGKEESIVRQTQSVAVGNHTHSNLPINILRKVGVGERYEGIEQVLQCVSQLLPNELIDNLPFKTHLKNFIADNELVLESGINTGKTSLTIDQFYKNLESDILNNKSSFNNYKLFLAALRIRYLIKTNNKFFENNNKNLEISALACIINSELRESNLIPHEIVSACQSGKDRDGLVLFCIQLYDLYFLQTGFFPNELSLSYNSNKTIFNRLSIELARAWHQQFMAGFQGSTLGASGIKPDTERSISNFWPKEAKQALVLVTAKYNKKLPSQIKLWHRALRQELIDDQVNDPADYLEKILALIDTIKIGTFDFMSTLETYHQINQQLLVNRSHHTSKRTSSLTHANPDDPRPRKNASVIEEDLNVESFYLLAKTTEQPDDESENKHKQLGSGFTLM